MNQRPETALGPTLKLDPELGQWPALGGRLVNRSLHNPRIADTRRALGLPTDRPVVMSGHQGTLWHPGILAKRLAMSAFASTHDLGSAWLVVDQDTPDPWTIEVPTTASELGVEKVHLARQRADEATPLCARLAMKPSDITIPSSLDSVQKGLGQLIEVLDRHSDAPTAAAQIERTTADLLHDSTKAIYASHLHATPCFERLLARMMENPEACAKAYNDAVAKFGGARLLIRKGEDWELPLWQIGAIRTPVFSSKLMQIPRETLAPKALLMTALVRLEACDLFIHGTGGGASESDGGYDRATEAWIGSWLGEALAPSVVVSADLRLPLMDGPLPEGGALERSHHQAHNAWHNPGQVGDRSRDQAKRALIREIESADDTQQRRRLFATLHRLLEDHHKANEHALGLLNDQIEVVRALVKDAQVAGRRDWCWALYDAKAIGALREVIGRLW